MSCITRGILRWGLIGGLALGGVTLLVGPEKVALGFAQVQDRAQAMVDDCIDDPVALRRQLQAMAEQYPERISEVSGELAEVEHQLSQYQRDIEVATYVVNETTSDLEDLKMLVSNAEARMADGARQVAIRFDGVRFDVDEAYAEGRRIKDVRMQYLDRLESDKVQAKFLEEQHVRLAEILEQLEDEYSTYQMQLSQLERQIETIQRNERLIELTEEQQATLESYTRFDTPNFQQIESRLAKIRREQEAQLQMLSKRNISRDYEERARLETGTDQIDRNPFDDVVELELKSDDTADSSTWDEPIIIEN